MSSLTENQRKSLDLQRNLVITAGAGSGKTTVLVHRYLHLLLHQPSLSVPNILAITFTEKATAEMKDRIFSLLQEQFRENRSQQARLFEVLNQMHEAQIFTIHAFCSHLIRQYPLACEQNPDFIIVNEVQIDDLLNQIFREFITSFDVKSHPQVETIMRALREFPSGKLRSFFSFFYRNRTILYPFLEAYRNLTPSDIVAEWRNIFKTFAQPALSTFSADSRFWELLGSLAGKTISPESKVYHLQQRMRENLQTYSAHTDDAFIQYAALGELITLLIKNDRTAYASPPGGKSAWGEDGISQFREISEIAARGAAGLLSFHPEREHAFADIQHGLAVIFHELLQRVDRAKAALNALDFEDLQIIALRLLQGHPEIREQLRKQYQFILVDEFQDTDHLQDRIIRLLTHDQLGNLDSNRLFIVGDPKQSIFGFRNADVTLFQQNLEEISRQDTAHIPLRIGDEPSRVNASTQELQGVIQLSRNFRSSPVLIDFFNQTFQTIFRQESDFDVPFQKLSAGRPEVTDQKSTVQFDVLVDESEDGLATDTLHAHQLAGHIKRIIEDASYQKAVKQGDHLSLEPITFGDIAILLRTRTHLATFEQIFRNTNIPYQTYKGSGFFQKEETRELYYFLQSLTHPEDDFALITVLRSPLVGLSDVSLFYLSQVNGINYWEKLQNLSNFLTDRENVKAYFQQDFADFLLQNRLSLQFDPAETRAVKDILSYYRSRFSLALSGQYSQLMDDMIETFHIRPLLGVQLDGKQKLANLDKLVHYIFEFEQSPQATRYDLLEVLRKQIGGETQEGEAVIMAEDENKVRILTYHSAKGMEFPVVFLPLLEKPFHYNQQILQNQNYGFAFDLDRSRTSPADRPFAYQFLRLLDEQKIQAEEKRLLYVAATRARDLLFLSAGMTVKSGIPQPGYLSWLLTGLGLKTESIQNGEIAGEIQPLPGTFLRVHQFSTTPLTEPFYAKQWESPEKVFAQIDPALLAALEEKPAQQIYTVTQLMLFREDKNRYLHHFYLNDGRIEPFTAGEEYPDQPGGEKWGSMVHQLLENFYRRQPAEDEERLQQLEARYLLTGDRGLPALREKFSKVLTDIRKSELAGKLETDNAFSEFGVSLRLRQFTLRGTFDLLFRNPGGLWEVVDYKTNRITAGQVERVARKYDFQMQAYALLLSSLYPEQVNYPVSLYFLEPGKIYRREYNRLQLTSIRGEINSLMLNLFQFESTVFSGHPDTKPPSDQQGDTLKPG